MQPLSRPWHLSCLLNATLGGRSDEPLCSWVYGLPDSMFRTVYLELMDALFDEPAHCLRVHAQWLCIQTAQLIHPEAERQSRAVIV